jgi:hypothetical protein
LQNLTIFVTLKKRVVFSEVTGERAFPGASELKKNPPSLRKYVDKYAFMFHPMG